VIFKLIDCNCKVDLVAWPGHHVIGSGICLSLGIGFGWWDGPLGRVRYFSPHKKYLST